MGFNSAFKGLKSIVAPLGPPLIWLTFHSTNIIIIGISVRLLT